MRVVTVQEYVDKDSDLGFWLGESRIYFGFLPKIMWTIRLLFKVPSRHQAKQLVAHWLKQGSGDSSYPHYYASSNEVTKRVRYASFCASARFTAVLQRQHLLDGLLFSVFFLDETTHFLRPAFLKRYGFKTRMLDCRSRAFVLVRMHAARIT